MIKFLDLENENMIFVPIVVRIMVVACLMNLVTQK